MEIDVAQYSVLSRVHGCRDGACVNATPATCRGKRPSKGGDVDERWKIFFGFSPLNFYSNPIVCLTPYVVTLIGLRCLFWRQRHDDVMLRGNRKFLPTTIMKACREYVLVYHSIPLDRANWVLLLHHTSCFMAHLSLAYSWSSIGSIIP